MRDPAEVYVERAIVHILDSDGAQGLVLSSGEIDLQPGDQVAGYFEKHIKKSLTDAAASAARFRSVHPAKASGICLSILSDGSQFVSGSRELARQLFKAMVEAKRTVPRLSPGDLVVALYRTNASQSGERFLALLKINPSNALRHSVESTPDGERVVIQVEEDVLQTAGERLQKCGFIRSAQPRPEYDMMVLDRQAGSAVKGVARFFLEAFLDAEPTFDAKQRTERLYGGLLEAHNVVRSQLSQEENIAVDAVIQGAIRSKSVSVDAILNQLPVTPDQRAEFETRVASRLPDKEFDIDPGLASKLVKKRYRGAQGVKFEVLESAYAEVVQSEHFDRERGFTEVILHVRDWKQVTR